MKAAVIGAIVGVAFGGGWGIVGAMGLPPPWRDCAVGLSVGISVALIVALAMSQAAAGLGSAIVLWVAGAASLF